MKIFELVCYLIAFIMFILCAFNHPNLPARWNLLAVGLAAWVLVPLALLIDSMN